MKYISGNLLKADTQALVNTVNTVGVMGKGDDKKLVFLPINLVLYLLEGMGATTVDKFPINSKTGLLQFGLLDEIIRGVGTVGGFIVGGPAGAAAGNALAHMVTGADVGKSLKRGVTAGAGALGYTMGGPLGAGLGTALSSGLVEGNDWRKAGMQGLKIAALTYGGDQLLGGPEGLMALGRGEGIQGSLGSYLGSSGFNGAGSTANMSAAQAGQQIADKSLGVTNAGGGGGGISGLFGKAGDLLTSPLGVAGITYALTNMGEKHKIKEANIDAKASNEAYERMRNDAGLNLPQIQLADRSKQKHYIKNPAHTASNKEPYYIEAQPYKEGGVVRRKPINPYNSKGIFGPGTGQSDSIRTDIPPGTYIMDASVVSDLGDGSSTAGLKVLEKTVKQIRSEFPKKVIKHVEKVIKKDSKLVPVYVANEEFPIDPVTVALKGGGSVEKGAKIFDKMVKNIRAHKNSKGLSLPPRAKHPLQYIHG